MDDPQAAAILRQLTGPDPAAGWTAFLDRYSPLLFDVVRRFERDDQSVSDCYLYVCEQLSASRFRRLLRFRLGGPARFSTWLCAVARNLCLDWHRREVGRYRVFESVARLPALDQQIFQGLYVDGLPIEDLFLELGPRHPGMTIDQVADGAARVEQALSPRQRWLLAVHRARGAPHSSLPADDDEGRLARIPDERPNPETWTGLRERREVLLRAMSRLAPSDRLVIRLRFDRELTLEEVARALGLDSPQAADRRIRDVLGRLHAEMTGTPGKGT